MTSDVADYVVVGAGSAGSIVASQLSSAGASVVLIEAGGTERRPDVLPPVGIKSLHATANWKYQCAPDGSAATTGDTFSSGRIVGGSGSINAMVYVRGRRSDFDGWRDAGCDGWSFDDVLPHFKAIESWTGGADDYRGADGPIAVSWCGYHHELDDAFIEAAVEAGHAHNLDQNGQSQLGVARTQVNQRRGLRSSSARGYLRALPRRQRPRLFTRTRVERVLFEGRRAVGVQCGDRVFRARETVVLCAGAIGTPALLMRSGVGPGGEVVDVPGVGENLQDHLVAAQTWTSRVATVNTLGPLDILRAIERFVMHGTGPLAVAPFQSQLFTDEFQIAVCPMHYSIDRATGRTTTPRADGFTIFTVLLRPEARGRVRLYNGSPRVEFVRLGLDTDRHRLVEGARLACDLTALPAMAELVIDSMADGAVPSEDGEASSAWLRRHELSIAHAAGTCRMGTDDDAVVDSALCVRDTENLRVVDASVMPTVPSGNPNAATMMIGHRGGQIMLSEA
ncbi:GMC family oxidoreductase [Gordonia sp. OPL2]|uniref:GMC family oxidoreductase n=1 Tax=Gordonia sp. OPL2 TaxID=2486274 RepID=UPI0016563CD4|nr:GMC family oxidoreductase N-terminal domain-containing protein [Gordonia sp. OPL2]ROZ98785.1 acetyltransferase [Gordonia sp. OPL2]